MKHVSLPQHFYGYVNNRYLGPNMPNGSTKVLIHGVYGREGQHLLTHCLLESGAHWSGIPLIALSTREDDLSTGSERQPWGCMGDDLNVSQLHYLKGLKVCCRLGSGRHTGIIIDWTGPFASHPQEHKPLSLIHSADGGFWLLPNNYFTLEDKHFTTGDLSLTKHYRRGETTWYEGDDV